MKMHKVFMKKDTSEKGTASQMKKKRNFQKFIKRRIAPAILAAVLCFAMAGILPLGCVTASAMASATAAIPVKQTVEKGSGTFSYELTAKDEKAPKPDSSSLSLTDTQSGGFTVISTAPGTWYYTLRIVKSNDMHYSYDISEYEVGIRFYNDNGVLQSEVLVRATDPESEYKSQDAHFKIIYGKTTPAPGQKPGNQPGSRGSTPGTSGSRTPAGENRGTSGGTMLTNLVKTGDAGRAGLYLLMLIAAGAVITALTVWRKKKNQSSSENA